MHPQPAASPQPPPPPPPPGDRAKTPDPPSAHVSAERLDDLRQEDARLHDLRERQHDASLVFYEEGEAVLRVRKSRVYEVPGIFTSAEAYVAARLGCSVFTTVRRAVMVEVYSRAEVAALLRQGVRLTTIERLAEAPPEIRGELEKVALQYKDDGLVAGAYAAWQREQKQARAARTAEQVLLSGVAETLKKRAAARSGQCQRCAHGDTRQYPRDGADKDKPDDKDQGDAAAREALRKAQAEVDELRDQNARHNGTVRALRAEIDHLRQHIASTPRPGGPPPPSPDGPPNPGDATLRAEAAALTRELAAATAELATLRQQHAAQAEAEAALASTKADLAAAQQDLAAARAELDRLKQAPAGTTPPGEPADAAEDPQRAASLFEWDEQLKRKAAALAVREAEIDKKNEALLALIADLRKAAADLKQREDQLEDNLLRYHERRQDLDQREQDFLAQVLQTQQAAFRWSFAPGSLGGTLIYIADALDQIYGTAAYVLHENLERDLDRLKPGEMALGLEAARQLNRTDAMVRRVARRTLEEFVALHPRLAEQEFAAFEDALGASQAPGGVFSVGAAGLVDIPTQGKLGEGFAVPIRCLAGSSRSTAKEAGLVGTTVNARGEREGVLIPLSRPLSLIVSGSPGVGKSNLLLVLLEMMGQPIKNISTCDKPALPVSIHLGLSAADYKSEMADVGKPNSRPGAQTRLEKLGAAPQGLALRTVVFVPPNLPLAALNRLKQDYPGAELRLIRFGKKDRFPGFLRALLNMEQNSADYLRWLDRMLLQLGEQASVDEVLQALELARNDKLIDSGTYGRCKRFLATAIEWMAPAARDHVSIWDDLEGAHVIIDLRSDRLMIKDAVGVVMALLGSLSQRRDAKGDLLAAVVQWDELTKALAQGKLSPVALTALLEVRHRLMTLLFGCHSLLDLPRELRSNNSGILAGRTDSAAEFEALCEARPAFADIGRATAASLRRGQFMACLTDNSDPALCGKAFIIDVRDACALPGGQTLNKSGEDEEE